MSGSPQELFRAFSRCETGARGHLQETVNEGAAAAAEGAALSFCIGRAHQDRYGQERNAVTPP